MNNALWLLLAWIVLKPKAAAAPKRPKPRAFPKK